MRRLLGEGCGRKGREESKRRVRLRGRSVREERGKGRRVSFMSNKLCPASPLHMRENIQRTIIFVSLSVGIRYP